MNQTSHSIVVKDLPGNRRKPRTAARHEHASLVAVARQLRGLERRVAELEDKERACIELVPKTHRDSARNFVHYLALRQHDLRKLQLELAELGLSSLGRSEGCVRASLLAVSRRAHEALTLRGDPAAQRELERLDKECGAALGWQMAERYLHEHTHAILGPRPKDRHVYIMVTAPSAKQADRVWMSTMLRAGMNVLRVNCAHEGVEQCQRMVDALVEPRRETGMACRLLMDLAGPKIRTGPVAGGRHIATWKPAKDELGRMTAPARVTLRRASAGIEEGAGQGFAVADEAFTGIRRGDELRFRDARGKKCTLEIREAHDDELVAYAERRAYVLDRADARLFRAGAHAGDVVIEVRDGEGAAIDVKAGDDLVLTSRDVKGRRPRRDRHGKVTKAGTIGCTLPRALEDARRRAPRSVRRWAPRDRRGEGRQEKPLIMLSALPISRRRRSTFAPKRASTCPIRPCRSRR